MFVARIEYPKATLCNEAGMHELQKQVQDRLQSLNSRYIDGISKLCQRDTVDAELNTFIYSTSILTLIKTTFVSSYF